MIEDRNDHQKIYTLSNSDDKCGTYKALIGTDIHKLCINLVQGMVNDCNLKLEQNKFYLGPPVLINSTSIITTIYRPIKEGEYPFLKSPSKLKNDQEFFGYIFRDNLEEKKVNNYCEFRVLQVRADREIFKYDKWHSIFYIPFLKSINLTYQQHYKLSKNKNPSIKFVNK